MYRHEPSDEELAAFMRYLATEGHRDLTPDKCLEVANYLIAASATYELRIDLRFYDGGLASRRQWEHGQAKTHWKRLIDLDLDNALAARPILSKADQLVADRFRVRRAIEAHPGNWRAQVAASGLSKAVFYRRRREILADGVVMAKVC